MIWHSNTTSDVLQELQVDPAVGLSAREASDRLKEYGRNSLQEQVRHSFVHAFLEQLRTPLTVLLLAVSGLVLILDLYTQLLKETATAWHLPIIVAGLAVITALLNAWRQYRAASAADTLHNLSAADARVRRDGAEQVCSVLSLVPGDIILLSAGDIVPADCRLITANRLRCDECALVGTTMPTEKYADSLFDDITPLAERTNMVYAGTAVTAGNAIAVVVATGTRSEMGHSRKRRPQRQDRLPAQRQVQRLTIWWMLAAVLVSVVALILGLICVSDRFTMLLLVATIVATAVPSGIAALYTHLTVGGIQRIVRHHIRIRHPEAVDTLEHVTVLAIEQDLLHQDGNVSLCRAFVGHRIVDLTADTPKAPGLGQLLRLAALNTPETDTAILSRLASLGIDKAELLLDMPRIGELPPTDERRTAVFLAGEQTLTLVSGAWRSLLPLCTKGNTEELTTAATEMEKDGLQVIAVTYRLSDTAPSVYTANTLEQDLTCVGLLGLHAPLCAAQTPVNNTVRTILFSNESAAIAAATAQNAGLTTTAYAAVGDTVRELSDADLATMVRHYNVYCSLDVNQKQRVLAALQQQGDVVALTAYGSDEAPLLTAADVGCARGTIATDVAKAAADLILTEDNHNVLLLALNEGRRLRREKVVLFCYLLVCSAMASLIGLMSLLGLFSLSNSIVLLMGLHLLLVALPTPLWLTAGISNAIHNFREKR